MESKITRGSDLKTDHITIKSSKNKYDRVSINLKYDNKAIVIQTPKMSMPWNLSCYQSSNKDDTYTVALSFKGIEENEEMEEFHNRLTQLDNLILAEGIKKKNTWFEGNLSDEAIKELYTPIIKQSLDKNTGEPDGKYPPTIRIKLPYRHNKFSLKVYDDEKKQFDLNNMPLPSILVKDKEIKALVELTSVWIINGKFGCSLNAVQIKLTQNKIKPISFLNGNSDESDDEFDVSSDDD